MRLLCFLLLVGLASFATAFPNRWELKRDDVVEELNEEEMSAISYALEHSDEKFSILELMKKMRDTIAERMSFEKLREYLDLFKDKGIKIIDLLREKMKEGKEKLVEFMKKIMGKEHREERSLKEKWEKLKEWFKDLEIKENFRKFGEWMKNKIKEGLDLAKDKMSTLKKVAKEIIDHSKQVSKEVAVEALEFLKPYKEDLGALWDQLVTAVKDIKKRED